MVSHDSLAVQRHQKTIVHCLRDPDISIRTRALDLVYALVNRTNAKELVAEMLNYLVVMEKEGKAALCDKIAKVAARFAPSLVWHINVLLTVSVLMPF